MRELFITRIHVEAHGVRPAPNMDDTGNWLQVLYCFLSELLVVLTLIVQVCRSSESSPPPLTPLTQGNKVPPVYY